MNSLQIKRVFWMLTLLPFTMAVQAQTKSIIFTPQWQPNAQFAGYIAARELGYYEQEGLHVTIKYPEGTKSSVEMLNEGKSNLITTVLANAIVTKSKGEADLVNVMQTSQHTAICLALKKPMEHMSVDGLRGMRVGLWHNSFSMTAEALGIQNHLEWQIVPFRRGFKLLSYGVLDAITVMEYNELLRLKYNGQDISENSVLRLCDHGFDIPEDGVYCTQEYYRQNANAVKAFIRATKKGWEWCRKNPDKATQFVVDEMIREHVSHCAIIQREGLKVILKKQEVAPGKVNYTLQRKQYEHAASIMQAAGFITTVPDFQTFIAR